MRVHDTLWVAGGAGGEEHGANIGGLDLVNGLPEKIGVGGGKGLAAGEQVVNRRQPRLGVVAQAARIVKVDVAQLRALVANFQQLVDLLLIFGESKTHLGVVDGEYALGSCSVLVERNRHGAKGLHCQHGGVQARAVGADHDHVIVPAQTGLVQAAGQSFYHLCQIGPGQRLPNAIFFFTHGRLGWPLARVIKKKSRKCGLHPGTLSSNE